MNVFNNSSFSVPLGTDFTRYNEVEQIVWSWLHSTDESSFYKGKESDLAMTIHILFTEALSHLREGELSLAFTKRMREIPFKSLGKLSKTTLFRSLGWNFNNLKETKPGCEVIEQILDPNHHIIPNLIISSGNHFLIPKPQIVKTDLPHLMKKEWDLSQERCLTDKVIEVGSTSFHIHAIKLAARSNYFKTMFSTHYIESTVKAIQFTYTCTPALFNDLLYFIYTNKIPALINELDYCLKLYELAHYTAVTDLQTICCSYLCRFLNTHTILDFACIAKNAADRELMGQCRWYVRTHPHFWHDIDFVQLNLKERLQFIDLCIDLGAVGAESLQEYLFRGIDEIDTVENFEIFCKCTAEFSHQIKEEKDYLHHVQTIFRLCEICFKFYEAKFQLSKHLNNFHRQTIFQLWKSSIELFNNPLYDAYASNKSLEDFYNYLRKINKIMINLQSHPMLGCISNHRSTWEGQSADRQTNKRHSTLE